MSNFIGKAITGSMIALSSLTGCDSRITYNNKAEEYMADKPAKEYIQMEKGWRNDNMRYADIQSSLDSVAYKDIFNGTKAAKDSSKIAEFNKIAAKMKVDKNINTYNEAFKNLDNKMLYMNITTKEHKMNLKEYKNYEYKKSVGRFIYNHIDNSKILQCRQFKADSIAYNQFFKKHNLLNDSVISQITKVSKKIKP